MIEKVHGINATCLTLDQRFTQLASANVIGPRRRSSINAGFHNQSKNNYWSPAWIEELSRQLEQAQKQFQARLGSGHMYRRLGNGAGVPGLRRSNSLGNLSQQSRGNSRASWRQSNGDLSSNRSVSFGGSTMGRRMRYKRRGMRRNRGVFNQNQGGRGFNRTRRAPPGVGRGGLRRNPGRGRGQAGGRGRGRGNYRGRGITRNQTKPLPTREELDKQLDQYMSGTKAALDKQLDEYMQNAMEFE